MVHMTFYYRLFYVRVNIARVVVVFPKLASLRIYNKIDAKER
jgi:hypothetical protein